MPAQVPQDGVHAMVPREKMAPEARKLRDTYNCVPGAPFIRKEFGWMVGLEERWTSEGHIDDKTNFRELFQFEPFGKHSLGQLGWCEAGFRPEFEEKIIEDRGEHEVVQDEAGRHVLYFKGRRSGFMPEYIDHPVKNWKTWEEDVKWRLNPHTPERYADLEERMAQAGADAAKGYIMCANIIGGYMYIRSLVGPEGALYGLYDMPDVIHDCMKTWLALADHVTAIHQKYVTIDEVYFGEDICYNHGPLISPDMMREFILPYYRTFLDNVRARNIDRSRHVYFQIDTDGLATPTIPIYQELGMDVMSPFEVASGCDVVEIAKQFPGLIMNGGVDKRVLAAGKKQIDKFVERVFPFMRARGGYYPTCDHAVPAEVSFDNYMHYRKRAVELGG